jgi:murein L,D-transpeptidase YafK
MKKLIASILFIGVIIVSVYYFYPEPKLPPGTKIDKLIVIKSERIMEAYSGDELVKTYKIALGRNPVGDKQAQGDKRTPEGEYTINDRNANSGYHKNLGVSYPDKADRAAAKALGVDPGGEIKIHGLKNGIGAIGKFHRLLDWTAGCIAVTDQEMDELYDAVENGTPILIKP